MGPEHPNRRWRVAKWDLGRGGLMFVIMLAAGLAAQPVGDILHNAQLSSALALLCLVLLTLIVFNPRYWWPLAPLLRALGDRVGIEEPVVLRQPWVVDGDTLRDDATGVTYRLANIDAPETGDNARCFNERQLGERAKLEAKRLVEAAKFVTMRRVPWRLDRYGRTIAYVLVDAEDLGELLIKNGFAHRWVGRRRKWCGPKSPLFKMALRRGETHSCKTCQHWREQER